MHRSHVDLDPNPRRCGLSASQAVQLPEIRERLLAMAEDHGDSEHQAAAIAMLETQKALDVESLRRFEELAIATSSPRSQDLAIKSIGEVMRGSRYRQEGGGCHAGECERMQQSLLDVGSASSSIDGQRLALEMVSDPPEAMAPVIVEQLGDLLQTGSTRWIRQMAAHALAFSGNPDLALATYRRAFLAEVELCTRQGIFRNVAVAAGARGLPLMAELAAAEPRLAGEYELFKAVYDSGVVDFDRVLADLFARVDGSCSLHQDGPLP